MATAKKVKIKIGFSRTTKKFAPFSWLIRWFQGISFSHVYLAWTSRGTGVEVVYHAAGTKLHFLSREIFDKRAKTIEEFEFELTRTQYKQLLTLALTMAGINYGFKQVLGIGIAHIFRLKKNPLSQGRKSQVCSELVGYFIEDVLGKPLDVNLDIAGPKEIYEIVKKLNK